MRSASKLGAAARRVTEAAAAGGAVRVDGHMVDAPVILKAERSSRE